MSSAHNQPRTSSVLAFFVLALTYCVALPAISEFPSAAQGAPALAAPTRVEARAVSPNAIGIRWRDNSSNEHGFEVNNGVESHTVPANYTYFEWENLEPGTYMCFKVRAYNDTTESAWAPKNDPYYVCDTTPERLPGQLQLPFLSGQTWYVCAGYNAYTATFTTHKNTPALDLTVRQEDVGTNGCYAEDGNVNASAGEHVTAPGAGRSIRLNDGKGSICLNLDSGKSMYIGHLDARTEGEVAAGDKIGEVATADKDVNGGYAHIHVQVHAKEGCARNGPAIPFSDDNGTRFAGAKDMPWDRSKRNQWRGEVLIRP